MKKSINRIILTFCMLFSVFIGSSLLISETSQSVVISAWGAKHAPDNTPTDIRQAVMNLTNWILGFISMICVLVIFYGLVSGADTIKYGFVGLIACGLAYAMVIVVSTVILGV